jgi:hypothetical protein
VAQKKETLMRAKMQCQSVKQSGYKPGEVVQEDVTLHAVYGPEGSANRTWATATPSGSLTLQINNPKAFGHFKIGGFYFVDLQEVGVDD